MLKYFTVFNKKESAAEKKVVTFNRKKFRFSDWLAEKVIKLVAFLSIAVVILIFIFVFREAYPIFNMDKTEVVKSEILVQESYGGGDNEKPATGISDNKPDNSNIINPVTDKPSSTLLTKTWMPVSDNPRYGLWPLFFGTLKVTLFALLFAGMVLEAC